MKPVPHRFVLGLATVLFSSAAAVAQTAYPTPVDSNTNNQIDSSEITDVIDALPSGGVVYLPANKTYNLASPIIVETNNITLLGEGHGVSTQGGTLLKITANDVGVIIRNCTGSSLRHCSLAAPSGHTTNAVRIENTTNATVDDVRITSAYRGIEILNSSGTTLTDVAMKNHIGDYGVKVWGNGGTTSNVQITRISSGPASGNTITEWLVIGPNVNGLTLQSSRFVGAYRGMRLTGSPGPTGISTIRFGCDNVLGEAVLVESGSGLTMVNSWIGQPNSSGMIIGSGFTGPANLTNLRIRGAYHHGLQVDGGSDINLWNPLIGANGTDPSSPTNTIAGVQVAASVSNFRVTGGRVGPLYSQGSSAKQYYGINFQGTAAQSSTQDVKSKGASLAGNTVPFSPSNLLTN
ncbi:MAG TPA: hypothetical protein VFT72_05005 [Opitutaceae bacterium]|nr:hypothetical protein [Opitutaceae bacterium]